MPLGKTRAPKSDGWGQTGLNYTVLQCGKSSFQPLAAAPASRRHLTHTDQYKSTPLICAKHSGRVTSDRSYLFWQVLDLTYHLSSYVKHRIRINFILRAPIPQNVITCLGLSQVRSVLLFDLLSHRQVLMITEQHQHTQIQQKLNAAIAFALWTASVADRYRQAEPQSPANKRPAFSALRCTRGTGESSSACTAKAVGFTAEDKLVA